MMNQSPLYDVTIIGGGPAGLYSAFYSGLREMKTKLIEYQPTLGGKLNVYPEKLIWDVGGVTPITGAKLMEQLIEQGMTFNPEVVLNEKVENIIKNDEGHYLLYGSSGALHRSKTVIVAVGGGILNPKKLDIEGADRFEITNLHYTVKSLEAFKGKRILISGGGNSAIDWANELEPLAEKVFVTYRNGELKGHESQVSQMLNSSVTCYFQTFISKLIAAVNKETIDQVELTYIETGEKISLPVDEVMINHGYERDSDLLQKSSLTLTLKNNKLIAGNAASETSEPGLFGAGDVLSHNGKLNLIAGTFQDAVNAVNKAKQFIQPQAEEKGRVSSHNEIFKEKNRKRVRE